MFYRTFSFWCVVMLIGGLAQADVAIQTVPIGDPGNAGEWSGASYGGFPHFAAPDRVCGSVDYDYRIGKFEVTNSQYTDFLNAVAASDPYGLYNVNMAAGWHDVGGIIRSGSDGNYKYAVRANRGDRPVNYVSFWDACRFCNWLNNNQPVGMQNASTTEDGAYTLNGYNGTDGRTIQRNAGARWAIPTEDEWYKAAYYKGGSTDAGYWDYPTSSDIMPGWDVLDASGNNANYWVSDVSPLDSPYYLTTVGEFQNSMSPCGAFDQGGNVWEWNETVIGSNRGRRGGAFYNHEFMNAATRLENGLPSDEDSGVGFRVVSIEAIPESSSLITFAGLLGIGLMGYGWRWCRN